MFNNPDFILLLSFNTQTKGNMSNVAYKIRKTIHKKIINYKETINTIYSLNAGQCDCLSSTFSDPYSKHIITRDIKIMKNNKIRKLLTKGLNYS